MVLVIVERESDNPLDVDLLVEMENQKKWCLDLRNIRFMHSYLSHDRQRMICVYEAPDAEAVREAQRAIGMPVIRVWSAELIGGDEGS